MQYTISDRAADKLRDLLRRHESGAGGASSGGGPHSLVFVQCLSATAVGGNSILSQCYPAQVLAPACDYALPPEVSEGGAVLLTLLTTAGASVAPTLDGVYLCVVSGDVESDGSGSGSGRVSGRPRCFGTEAVGAASPASPIAGAIPVLDSAGNLDNTAIQYSADPVNGDPASQYRQYTQDTPTGTSVPQFLQQVATNGNGAGTPTITQQALPSGSVGNAVYVQTFTPSLVQQAYTLNGAATLTQTMTESGGVYTLAAAGATLAYTGTYDFSGATLTGVGTVTSVSSGGLSPLFTVAVATETSTPAISFARMDAGANTFYGGPALGGLPALPTFRGISAEDLPDLSGTYQSTDADLTAIAALATETFGRSLLTQATAAATLTTLGGTTVGANLFTLTNPSAITFPRINANNTVDALDAAAFRAAIGAGTGGGDALTTNPLSQFAATTSSQLRGVLSDETGTGLAYFQGGDLGTPSAGVLTNATGTAAGLTAGTATALATARTINGTSFDGTANVTVTAAASTLTGATLASGVTASSLTSFGASIALGTPASGVLTNATGLPVAGGGSGRAVTVAYAPICGGTTTTSAQQSVASVGTSGQVLTSAGAAALPTFADPVTGTTAEVVATATQTLGAVANTLEDVTGLTLTLPAAGTYDVFASLLGNVANSSGSYPQIFGSLDLNGSAVANSGFLAVSGNGVTGEAVGTGSIRMLVVAAGAHVLKVRAKWTIAGGGTITTKNLAANANGPIRLNYVRIK